MKVEPTGYPERLDTGWKEKRNQRFLQGLWPEERKDEAVFNWRREDSVNNSESGERMRTLVIGGRICDVHLASECQLDYRSLFPSGISSRSNNP